MKKKPKFSLIQYDIQLVVLFYDYLFQDEENLDEGLELSIVEGGKSFFSEKMEIASPQRPHLLKSVKPSGHAIPLLEHLKVYKACTIQELQVLFNNLDERRKLMDYMRYQLRLFTSHLKPTNRNFPITAHSLTPECVQYVLALGGYLGVTVRQYYYIKHGVKLRHPYMPCIIEYGNNGHHSYYPLEVVKVVPSGQ
jgi:hypothetical protein